MGRTEFSIKNKAREWVNNLTKTTEVICWRNAKPNEETYTEEEGMDFPKQLNIECHLAQESVRMLERQALSYRLPLVVLLAGNTQSNTVNLTYMLP